MPEKEFGVAVVAPMHGDDHEDGDPYRHPGQEEIRVGIKIEIEQEADCSAHDRSADGLPHDSD